MQRILARLYFFPAGFGIGTIVVRVQRDEPHKDTIPRNSCSEFFRDTNGCYNLVQQIQFLPSRLQAPETLSHTGLIRFVRTGAYFLASFRLIAFKSVFLGMLFFSH